MWIFHVIPVPGLIHTTEKEMKRARLAAFAGSICLVVGLAAFCPGADVQFAVPTHGPDFTKGEKPAADACNFSLHLGMSSGTPNGTMPRGSDGNQLLVVKYTEGQHSHGVLQEGDVILGVSGTMFTNNVIDIWRAAIDEASQSDKDGRVNIIRWRNGIVSTVDFLTVVVPDFTKGATRDDAHDWTLGPMGARGWIWGKNLETTKARQILVTKVDKGSPADSRGRDQADRGIDRKAGVDQPASSGEIKIT